MLLAPLHRALQLPAPARTASCRLLVPQHWQQQGCGVSGGKHKGTVDKLVATSWRIGSGRPAVADLLLPVPQASVGGAESRSWLLAVPAVRTLPFGPCCCELLPYLVPVLQGDEGVAGRDGHALAARQGHAGGAGQLQPLGGSVGAHTHMTYMCGEGSGDRGGWVKAGGRAHGACMQLDARGGAGGEA